jgi:hypothetical protein
MKYITLYKGKTIHLVDENRISVIASEGTAFCGRFHSAYNNDVIHDKLPTGKLCEQCKKAYLKEHTEEELFLEMI